MAIDFKKMQSPATKGELAFAIADQTISSRMILTALLALRNGDEATFRKQLEALETHAGKMWSKYLELTGQEGMDV
jgi:hypothetical protein